jgi:hypothetical protein
MKAQVERDQCIFCNDSINEIDLTESNRNFLLQRVREHNLDEAVTISKIAWDNFPLLKESADTRKIVETVLEGIQQTVNNQIFSPITASINALNTLAATLQNNPRQIQESSKQTIQSLNESIKQVVFTINNGPSAQIRQIQEMMSQLLYKPNIKGAVGETVLADIWPQYYRFDFIERLGGSGREDFIVTPYLNSSVSRHGDRISIERKTGKQKYTGSHFGEAVQHASARGISYSIIVYDTEENLPEKTIIVRENGVLVAVADIQSGTWQMARDMFEVLQKELDLRKKNVMEVKMNMKVIQEVSNDISTLIKFTTNIKMNNTKIQSLTEKIDEDTKEIAEAVNLYKNKLRSAIG